MARLVKSPRWDKKSAKSKLADMRRTSKRVVGPRQTSKKSQALLREWRRDPRRLDVKGIDDRKSGVRALKLAAKHSPRVLLVPKSKKKASASPKRRKSSAKRKSVKESSLTSRSKRQRSPPKRAAAWKPSRENLLVHPDSKKSAAKRAPRTTTTMADEMTPARPLKERKRVERPKPVEAAAEAIADEVMDDADIVSDAIAAVVRTQAPKKAAVERPKKPAVTLMPPKKKAVESAAPATPKGWKAKGKSEWTKTVQGKGDLSDVRFEMRISAIPMDHVPGVPKGTVSYTAFVTGYDESNTGPGQREGAILSGTGTFNSRSLDAARKGIEKEFDRLPADIRTRLAKPQERESLGITERRERLQAAKKAAEPAKPAAVKAAAPESKPEPAPAVKRTKRAEFAPLSVKWSDNRRRRDAVPFVFRDSPALKHRGDSSGPYLVRGGIWKGSNGWKWEAFVDDERFQRPLPIERGDSPTIAAAKRDSEAAARSLFEEAKTLRSYTMTDDQYRYLESLYQSLDLPGFTGSIGGYKSNWYLAIEAAGLDPHDRDEETAAKAIQVLEARLRREGRVIPDEARFGKREYGGWPTQKQQDRLTELAKALGVEPYSGRRKNRYVVPAMKAAGVVDHGYQWQGDSYTKAAEAIDILEKRLAKK